MKTNSPSNIFTGKIVRHPETIENSKVFSNENHVLTVSLYTIHLDYLDKIWNKKLGKFICKII